MVGCSGIPTKWESERGMGERERTHSTPTNLWCRGTKVAERPVENCNIPAENTNSRASVLSSPTSVLHVWRGSMSQNAIKTEARVRNLIDILGALALESFVSLRALNDGDPTMAFDLILEGLGFTKLQGSFCCKKWSDMVRALSPVPCKENFACRMWNPGFGIRNSAICSLRSR